MHGLSKIAIISALISLYPVFSTAQSVTGSTTIGFDSSSGMVTATCETDLDGDAQAFYEAVVHCAVYDTAGTQVAYGQYIDHNGVQGYAQAIVTFSGVVGTTYTAYGDHLAVANISDYAIPPPPQSPYWEYDDFYNFYFFHDDGEPPYPDENIWWGPGPDTERRQSTIKTGSTYDSVTVSSCFARLKFRPVPYLPVTRNHSFWYIQDSNGYTWIIDAGPSVSCFLGCGYLNDWITSGIAPFSGHYPADNTGAVTAWSIGPSSGQLCNQVDDLYDFAEEWANDTTPDQKLGPNSNTFTHDAGNEAGFTITTPPPNATGW